MSPNQNPYGKKSHAKRNLLLLALLVLLLVTGVGGALVGFALELVKLVIIVGVIGLAAVGASVAAKKVIETKKRNQIR